MASDPFSVFEPTPLERPSSERSSLRNEVEQLATQVAALRELVEKSLLPVLSGQGMQGMPGQLSPGPGALFPTNLGMSSPGMGGQPFLQPVVITQHDARRTVLHHLNGNEVTIGGIEQHTQIDPFTGSRQSEQTMHRYLSLDGRSIRDQGEVFACTSCQTFPLIAPHFCSACQEPTCSGCITRSENGGAVCQKHGPRRRSFWDDLFG